MAVDLAPDEVAERASVRCENVTKTFGTGRTAVHALRGVNLEVRDGRIDDAGRAFRLREDNTDFHSRGRAQPAMEETVLCSITITGKCPPTTRPVFAVEISASSFKLGI